MPFKEESLLKRYFKKKHFLESFFKREQFLKRAVFKEID